MAKPVTTHGPFMPKPREALIRLLRHRTAKDLRTRRWGLRPRACAVGEARCDRGAPDCHGLPLNIGEHTDADTMYPNRTLRLTLEIMADRIELAFRNESGRVLATLIRLLGDFELAEDAMQDAFAAAVVQWPSEGIPALSRLACQ